MRNAALASARRQTAQLLESDFRLNRAQAFLAGRALSDFVVAASLESANRTIEETHVIRLAAEDQARFAEMLLNPPELSPAMKRAQAAHARLVTESR